MSNARDKANIPSLNFSSTGIDDNATSTAITIDSSERVGVGTSSPISDAKLTVSSDNTESNIFFERSGSAYDTAIANSSGNILFKGGASSSTVSGLNELMRITSSGNVGIGTTSPVSDAKLTISSNSTESYVFFQRSGSTMHDTAIGNNGGNILFKGGSDSSTVGGLSERMRITSSGNVGIGTSTPDELLTVALSGSTGTYFEAGGTTDNSNARRLTFTSSTTTNAGDTHTLNAESSTGNIAFATFNSERMRINNSGNVGIGTSSPTQKLDVSGTVKATAFEGDGSGLSGVTSVGGDTGVDFNDNVKARFGTGNDLEIYHSGSNSIIDEVGTGYLQIRSSNNLILKSATDENYINCIANGAVELYHDNSKKLETTSTGIDVTGNIEPASNDAYDLGASGNVWRNIYTGDLHLSNEAKSEGNSVDGTKGNWTIQEGSDDLFIVNNKSGKKYKFKLEEI